MRAHGPMVAGAGAIGASWADCTASPAGGQMGVKSVLAAAMAAFASAALWAEPIDRSPASFEASGRYRGLRPLGTAYVGIHAR